MRSAKGPARGRARGRVGALVAGLALLVLPAHAQATADVEVVDSAFQPAETTVDAGGTVTWTQTGSLPHSVTADGGSFDSHPDCSSGDCMQAGETFSHTFDEPGTYAYHCRVHGAPGGVGMSGTVTVAAAGGATEEPGTEEPGTAEPTESGEPPATVTGAIEVADQSGDGSSVTVSSVTIDGADGFVVVHADDGGAPGAVLGHVAISEGTSSRVTVRLDQRLSTDATVWPMLHVDAGTLGTYEFPGPDGPVVVDGAPVMAPLELTVAAADAGTDAAGELAETGAPALALLTLGLLGVGAGTAVLRRRRSLPRS